MSLRSVAGATVWLVLIALLVGTAGCQTSGKGASNKANGKSAVTDYAAGLASDDELERRTKAHAAFAAGVLFQERDEPDAAYEQFARAAANDPANEALATEVASHYLQKNQPDQALVVLQRTAATPEASGVIKTLLADTLRQSGRTNQAVAAYCDAIRASPTLLGSYQELASLYLALKQPERAEAVLRQALQVHSDQPEFWINTADLFAWYGHNEPAARASAEAGMRTALDKAAALKTTDPVLQMRLGRGYLKLGENAKAEALFQQASATLPKNPGVSAGMAEVLIREGRLKEARQHLELLSRANPTAHEAWYFLGVVDLEEHQDAAAQRKFERAINLSPDFEPAYTDLAVSQINQNRTADALATLERARTRFPDSFRVLFITGMTQSRLKKFDDALATFRQAEALALKSSPELVDYRFYFQVGATLEQGGHEAEAVEYLEKALKLNPDFAQALNHLGYMWADKGVNLTRAREMIEKAVKAEPDNPAYLDSLGWVLFRAGQPAEALPPIEQAIKLVPEPDATLFDHLGDVLAALGRTAEAKEAWRKSLAIEKNAKVQAKLDATP